MNTHDYNRAMKTARKLAHETKAREDLVRWRESNAYEVSMGRVAIKPKKGHNAEL